MDNFLTINALLNNDFDDKSAGPSFEYKGNVYRIQKETLYVQADRGRWVKASTPALDILNQLVQKNQLEAELKMLDDKNAKQLELFNIQLLNEKPEPEYLDVVEAELNKKFTKIDDAYQTLDAGLDAIGNRLYKDASPKDYFNRNKEWVKVGQSWFYLRASLHHQIVFSQLSVSFHAKPLLICRLFGPLSCRKTQLQTNRLFITAAVFEKGGKEDFSTPITRKSVVIKGIFYVKKERIPKIQSLCILTCWLGKFDSRGK